MIISLTGPSGAGKTTLLHNVIGAMPGAAPLVSYTTRAPRPSDEPGEYDYLSFEEFEQLAQSGAFLWEARTTKNRYGTKKSGIDAALEDGLYLPILVLSAAQNLHDYARAQGKENAIQFLYISVDDEVELRRRFKERGEKPQEIEARLQECRSWLSDAQKSDVPFSFIDATGTREETLKRALTALGRE